MAPEKKYLAADDAGEHAYPERQQPPVQEVQDSGEIRTIAPVAARSAAARGA